MTATADTARARRIADLKEEVRAIAATGRRSGGVVLPFDIAEIDSRLASGGLAAAALHEATGGAELADDAAATLFMAGLAARRCAQAGPGSVVLWAFARRGLFAPGLAQAGLGPERLIHAEAGSDAAVLAVMEEGLRHGGLAAVIGEVEGAAMPATRRLQLAAEEGGVTALLLRRPKRAGRDPLSEPSAAATRWRLACAPSVPLPEPVGDAGIGRACWRLDLVRQRGGDGFSLTVEAADAEGRLALPARLRDRPDPAARGGQDRLAAA